MDALFLKDHPGWTWRDLDEAPADLIDVIRELDRAQSEVAKARENNGALR